MNSNKICQSLPLLHPPATKTRPSFYQMPLPLVNSKKPKKRTDWVCKCRKCGSEGKHLTRPTWYRHNHGGIKAAYGPLSDTVNQEIDTVLALCRPASEKWKRSRHQEDQEVEDPPHTSKRVAGLSSVRLALSMRMYGLYSTILIKICT